MTWTDRNRGDDFSILIMTLFVEIGLTATASVTDCLTDPTAEVLQKIVPDVLVVASTFADGCVYSVLSRLVGGGPLGWRGVFVVVPGLCGH